MTLLIRINQFILLYPSTISDSSFKCLMEVILDSWERCRKLSLHVVEIILDQKEGQ